MNYIRTIVSELDSGELADLVEYTSDERYQIIKSVILDSINRRLRAYVKNGEDVRSAVLALVEMTDLDIFSKEEIVERNSKSAKRGLAESA